MLQLRDLFTRGLHHLLLYLQSLQVFKVTFDFVNERLQIDWNDVRKSIHPLLTKYRWALIVFIVIPISFLYDLQYRLRSWFVWTFLSAPALHDFRVKQIQKQVQQWSSSKSTRPMVKIFLHFKAKQKVKKLILNFFQCTARPTWASMSTRVSVFKKECHQIELNLHDILEVNVKRRIVRLEPYVNMGQITDHLNRIGWTLALTVEMEDLTVGGLLMGMGLENNSHRYGMFHEICSAYEIVTSDGNLVRATATENFDLFRALPGSHGTLGFLVAAELAIVPCKKWLKVNYIPCYSQEELKTRLFDLTQDAQNSPDFVEATVYSRSESVIFTADFCEPPTWIDWFQINRFNLWFKPMFYKHVESHLKVGKRSEFVPIRHWFHRHTRSIFWELEDLVPFSNQWWYRWSWAVLGPPKVSLLKAFWTKEIRYDLIYRHVVQDILVPLDCLELTIDKFDNLFGICEYLIIICVYYS